MAAPDPYLQPPLALFTDARLTDGDRTVYCLLTSFGDHGTLANCHPSLGTIAKRGSRDRSGVVRSLVRLIACGWVTREARASSDGDQDTSAYFFPFHRVVDKSLQVGDETHLPSGRNAPTVGDRMHRGVGDETHHNLEPFTKSQEPREEPATPMPVEQLSLKMTAAKQAEPKPMNETFAKAHKVAAMWTEIMRDQPSARADVRNMRVLAAALDVHGEDGLRRLLTWAHTQDWHSGRKGSKQIGWWMARDHLSVVAKDHEHAGSGVITAPRQLDNRLQGPKPKEIPNYD